VQGVANGRYHLPTEMAWTTRLYASSIAIVSGAYAIAAPAAAMVERPMMMDGSGVGLGGWIMLGVGIIVLVHGIVLLAPAATRLGGVSGPLMVIWALVMLANQGVLAVVPGWGMMRTGMGWDAGMVAIAVLMLASGLIMSAGRTGDMRR
jgi:hypothetical protein